MNSPSDENPLVSQPDVDIVGILACVLHQLCTRNDRLNTNQRQISKFHALKAPPITIREYLQRIAKYSHCSRECFVLALVYIDRIIQGNPAFTVNSFNIHRILITSIMLAAKFFDDQYYNNAYYAKVGGVPPQEMNNLEVEFLFMNNFSLFVTPETYSQYYNELCNHFIHRESTCTCPETHPNNHPNNTSQPEVNSELQQQQQQPQQQQQTQQIHHQQRQQPQQIHQHQHQQHHHHQQHQQHQQHQIQLQQQQLQQSQLQQSHQPHHHILPQQSQNHQLNQGHPQLRQTRTELDLQRKYYNQDSNDLSIKNNISVGPDWK